MEIRNKKIGNNNWQLVNEYWEKGYSWGHRTIVFKNGYEMAEHKCKYINRTWESYTYETCMLCAIDEIEETEKNRFINDYKYQNNIDRFKKGQKDEVIKMFEETEKAKELKTLKEVIRNRDFD